MDDDHKLFFKTRLKLHSSEKEELVCICASLLDLCMAIWVVRRKRDVTKIQLSCPVRPYGTCTILNPPLILLHNLIS
jgi:hypothetical protein